MDEKELVDEVVRIKAFLDRKKNADNECGSWEVYDSLRKLQEMVISVSVLKETMIGESVSALQKHVPKHVSRVARLLILKWRRVVDEWVVANENSVVNVVAKGPATPEQNVEWKSSGLDEVWKIKQILEKCGLECEGAVVCDLLKKVPDMGLSVETLEATGIGKVISVLKKHESNDVKQIVRMMTKDWNDMTEEWMEADEKKSVVVPMSIPQRPKILRIKFKKAQGNAEKDSFPCKGSDETSDGALEVLAIKGGVEKSKSRDESKSECESLSCDSIRKPMRLEIDSQKAKNQNSAVTCDQQCKKPMILDMATIKSQKVSNGNIDKKMEATKRKLQYDYKVVENMRKKRKIQVMELDELTSHGLLPPKDQSVKSLNKQFRKSSNACCR